MAMSFTPVFAGEYTTDFNEATIAALSPGVFGLGGDATASIGGSQLTLSDATGLGLLQSNSFGVLPEAPATVFVNGLDITVVLDASTINGMKTTQKAWSGIALLGSSSSPLVFFGPCGANATGFLGYFLIPSAQWPGGTTQAAQIPSMSVCALNRLGGNRIPWYAPLPDTPADTTLRVVVDGSMPPKATFYVDGVPVLSDYEIGPNKIAAAGVGQQAAALGAQAFPITTSVKSFQLVGDGVPFYPPPLVEGVITCNVGQGWIEAGMRVVLTAPTGTSYQWKEHGEQLIGETAQTLVFDPVAESDAGEYTVVYDTGTKELQETALFVLDVLPAGSLPVSGLVGLGLLGAAMVTGGAAYVRRKK
jgi:hypothetical protein